MVNVVEIPRTITPVECTAPVATVKHFSGSQTTGVFDLENSTTRAAADAIFVDVLVDGRIRTFAGSVALDPGATTGVSVDLVVPGEIRRIRVCKDRPWGINEGPDPVVGIATTQPIGDPI